MVADSVNYKQCLCKEDHDLGASRMSYTDRVSGNVQCEIDALTRCYSEYDVRYHVESAGLTNLNAAETDKYQDSMDDCRTYCRHINILTFHG